MYQAKLNSSLLNNSGMNKSSNQLLGNGRRGESFGNINGIILEEQEGSDRDMNETRPNNKTSFSFGGIVSHSPVRNKNRS